MVKVSPITLRMFANDLKPENTYRDVKNHNKISFCDHLQKVYIDCMVIHVSYIDYMTVTWITWQLHDNWWHYMTITWITWQLMTLHDNYMDYMIIIWISGDYYDSYISSTFIYKSTNLIKYDVFCTIIKFCKNHRVGNCLLQFFHDLQVL